MSDQNKANTRFSWLLLIIVLIVVIIAAANSLGSGKLLSLLNITSIVSSTPLPVIDTQSNISQSTEFTPTPTILSPLPDTPLPVQPGKTQFQFSEGLLVMSIYTQNSNDLFLFHPNDLQLTRITTGPSDDIDPSISPDGTKIAFSSNRNGWWDLFILTLSNGEITQLTDSPATEASPSWSPDGLFLVYASDLGGDFNLFILDFSDTSSPIQLTSHRANDFSPAWSPKGRSIAFVSQRTGNSDIWLANLDDADHRFVNISSSPTAEDNNPAWSQSGDNLSWSTSADGLNSILVWPTTGPIGSYTSIGTGDRSTWLNEPGNLIAVIPFPKTTYLTGYKTDPWGLFSMPVFELPGPVDGLDWGNIQFPSSLSTPLSEASNGLQEITSSATLSTTLIPMNKTNLVTLPDVDAPYPYLHEDVYGSFNAMREFISIKAGWDFLQSLENAFIWLTAPLPPGMGNDWLYTGRGIAINPSAMNAGWLIAVKEEYLYDTYWRLYIKTQRQDGTQGRPLTSYTWNFNARNSGDPASYEQGGALSQSPPDGYWIDFTRIAADYGWYRQPALINWRSFYQGAKFTEYINLGNSSWEAAILDLYPPEVLITPTEVLPITPSATPTRTTTPTITPTPSLTPTPTPTSTPTPSSSGTSIPSITPSITSTSGQ